MSKFYWLDTIWTLFSGKVIGVLQRYNSGLSDFISDANERIEFFFFFFFFFFRSTSRRLLKAETFKIIYFIIRRDCSNKKSLSNPKIN